MMMTEKHPRWIEFLNRLSGPEGINFRTEEGEELQKLEEQGTALCECRDGHDKTATRAILKSMGLSPKEIDKSCYYFEQHNEPCDCAIACDMEIGG